MNRTPMRDGSGAGVCGHAVTIVLVGGGAAARARCHDSPLLFWFANGKTPPATGMVTTRSGAACRSTKKASDGVDALRACEAARLNELQAKYPDIYKDFRTLDEKIRKKIARSPHGNVQSVLRIQRDVLAAASKREQKAYVRWQRIRTHEVGGTSRC